MNEDQEVREKAIEQMMEDAMKDLDLAIHVYEGDVRLAVETLYDAGYRKFEIVDEQP